MMYSRTLRIGAPSILTGTFGPHAICLARQHQRACETPVLGPRDIKSLPWTIIVIQCWYASEENSEEKCSSQNANTEKEPALGDGDETITQT